MKSILFLGLVLISHLSFAQSPEEVKAAAEKFRLAMLAEDHETLRTLTSKDLSYGHSGGLVENQEQFLKVFESKTQDYQVWDVRDLTVSFHGETIAMMRYYVDVEIVTNEVPNKLDLGLLMVWIKEEGAWKLLARQAFRVPK